MHPAGCLTQPHIALMRRCPRARVHDATTTRRDAGWSSRSGCRLAVVCTMRWTPYGRTAAPVGRYMWGTRLQRAGQRALLLSMASRTSSTALTTWPTFAKAPACPATHPLATRHLHTSLPILLAICLPRRLGPLVPALQRGLLAVGRGHAGRASPTAAPQ